MSTTFKIFDPLGLLTPCTLKPKALLQKLWSLKLEWDEPVPDKVLHEWERFINNVGHLKFLAIPRNVVPHISSYIELHCFSDASQIAYGACIYVKTFNSSGEAFANLLCARSRLCPLKTSTIPRLELCGALLAARLCDTVCSALRKPILRCTFWTDSTVVLAWLKTCPSKLKTYVANRVSAIQSLTKEAAWRHVPTEANPADLASRGLDPQFIESANLWWHGPPFILLPDSQWPTLAIDKEPHTLPESKITCLHTTTETTPSIIDFSRFSNYKRLLHTMAYIHRFINIKCKQRTIKGPLCIEELECARISLIKLSQRDSFPDELKSLNNNKVVNSKSKLIALTPFLDSQGILRVGGRLHKSNLEYSQKHPILLCTKHTLTQLIFTYEHRRLLHAGLQLLLSSVREQFWPIAGRDLARRTTRKCVICRRQYGKTLTNIMGTLPSQRLVPDFPYSTVSVDCGGPYLITDRRGRGCKITKCYLCLFICLRYKCVHLEAVSELSKEHFILALRRFIARRGKPKEIISDNGRNFVSAAKEIQQFFKLHSDSIAEFASDHDIKFSFSPAYAPNFNGYVEAGIKSAKFHLKRIMGNTHLTFEELSTLFAQIEAILNSRPLTPLSPSPNDYNALTPGHFLLGRPLTSLPGPSLLDENMKRLNRYQLLEQLRQHFWKRWQSEYVAELQQRSKWRTRRADIKPGDLVVLKEDNLPPLMWRMGRIEKTYPGTDGVPRVADIRTPKGITRRALNRMCILLEES